MKNRKLSFNGYKSLFKNEETFKNINFVKPGEILELDLNTFQLSKKKKFSF